MGAAASVGGQWNQSDIDRIRSVLREIDDDKLTSLEEAKRQISRLRRILQERVEKREEEAEAVVVEGENDITLNLSTNTTLNGEVLQTGIEKDTLGDLNCTAGQMPVLDTTNSIWVCGTDSDTTLTGDEVPIPSLLLK